MPRLLPLRSVLLYSKNSLSQFPYLKYNFKRCYRRETSPNRVYSWCFATKPLYFLFKSLVPRLLPSISVLVHLENSLSQFRSSSHNFKRFYRRETAPTSVYSWYLATKLVNFLVKSLVPRLLPFMSILRYSKNSLSQFPYVKYNFKRCYRRETAPNRVYSWCFATKPLNYLFKSLVKRLLPFRSVLLYWKNSLSQFTYAKYNFKRFHRRETAPNSVYLWYFATKPLSSSFKSLVPRVLPCRSVLLYLENSLS